VPSSAARLEPPLTRSVYQRTPQTNAFAAQEIRVTASPQPPRTSESTPASPSASTRIVKRYSNRKLYDTVESRYVTLPQIAELVRKGEDVRIIDNNTKEDLTSVTMAQILYEEERKQSRALPLGALKDLIFSSGERLMSSLREGPMGKLIGGKSEPPVDGTPAVQTTADAGPMSAAGKASAKEAAERGRLQEMLEQSRSAFDDWQHRVDDRVRKVLEGLSPTSQVEKLSAEVRKLSAKVDELEARLAAKSGRKD